MKDNFNDITFFKLWRNIVINGVIFTYASLYKKNKRVEFNDKTSLLSYGEREYITELIYSYYGKPNDNSMLIKGDLPENGVLKVVDLSKCSSRIKSCDFMPQGTEVIHFNNSGYINAIQLSELPLSIHTISNLLLKKPYADNKISENITSLSFYHGMDSLDFYHIKLPCSLKVLNLGNLNLLKSELTTELPLDAPSKSFIPSSVTDLSIHYDEKLKSNFPTIPPSVTKLKLTIGGNTNCTLENGLIPSGVKDLFIHCLDYVTDIKLLENCLPISIKKLGIHSINGNMKISYILSKVIPNIPNELYINSYKYPLPLKDLCPIGLTKLEIKSRTDDIDQIDDILPSLFSELPSSIIYLSIDDKIIDLPK